MFDEGLKNISFTSDYFIGKYIKNDLANPASKEVFLRSGSLIDQQNLDIILEFDISTLEIADVNPVT